MKYRELPINLKLELVGLIKEYFLGKWVESSSEGLKGKIYRKIVYRCWKLA